MATVRSPSSVAARKTRMEISLRLATSNFLNWRFGASDSDVDDGRVLPGLILVGRLYRRTARQGKRSFLKKGRTGKIRDARGHPGSLAPAGVGDQEAAIFS